MDKTYALERGWRGPEDGKGVVGSAQRTRVFVFVKASRHALNVISLIIIFHLPYLIRLGSFDFCKTPLITLQIPCRYKQSHHKHFQQSKFYFQQSFIFYMQERQL